MVVRVLYETHATTVDNENGIATGWLPGELSATGHDNARDLGRRRRDDALDGAGALRIAGELSTPTAPTTPRPRPIGHG